MVEIDPETGMIERHVFVGSEPSVIEPRRSSPMIYVGLGGASEVKEVDIASMIVAGTIQFPPEFNTTFAGSIAIVEDELDTVAISLRTSTFVELILFRDGVREPISIDSSEISASEVLYHQESGELFSALH